MFHVRHLSRQTHLLGAAPVAHPSNVSDVCNIDDVFLYMKQLIDDPND